MFFVGSLFGVLAEAFGLTVGFVACGLLGLLSLMLIRAYPVEQPGRLT